MIKMLPLFGKLIVLKSLSRILKSDFLMCYLVSVMCRVLFGSFNQLDLPAYETYDKLRRMLILALNECSEGFGLA